ncbi:MAG: HPP family protein [Gemmatimonadales bacterium]
MTREPRTPSPPNGRVTVADLMTRDVVSVRSDAPIQEAVALLADSHVTGLAVVDGHGKLVGVVSASDVLAAEAEAGDTEDRARLLATGVVADVMSPSPLTTPGDADAREAALQMDYADVHRLFVIEDHRPIGVISRSDINRAFAAGRLQ